MGRCGRGFPRESRIFFAVLAKLVVKGCVDLPKTSFGIKTRPCVAHDTRGTTGFALRNVAFLASFIFRNFTQSILLSLGCTRTISGAACERRLEFRQYDAAIAAIGLDATVHKNSAAV
jgi:hypothetical protein